MPDTRRAADATSHPTFDPVKLGRAECQAWVSYYRHEWATFLGAAVAMVHEGFGMSRSRSVTGAWYVLRANQAWAPYPDNDPDGAIEQMRRFYALVAESGSLDVDPVRASRLEVDWWRVHREHQHDAGVTHEELVDTLNRLYSYVYDASSELTVSASQWRVEAMDLSDAWVESGRLRDDPLVAQERLALVASYTSLRDAIERRADR